MIALADARPARRRPGAAPRGRAGCWTRKCATPGDWSVGRPGLEPAGWFFEYRNELLPRHRRHRDGPAWRCGARRWPTTRRSQAATRRGLDWLLAMQNRDGGWAAFDTDNDNEVLTKVPFADHNAMLDPSCADITGRVLEALGTLRLPRRAPGGRRGPSTSSWQTQEPRRLLVRPLGRQLHLRHLAGPARACGAIGVDMDRPARAPGGRLAASPSRSRRRLGRELPQLRRPVARRARAPPTASQTAWAVLGLIAAGRRATPTPSAAASTTCSTPSAPTAPGTRPSSPAPASRGSST